MNSFNSIALVLGTLVLIGTLQSCSSRSAPAPVLSLSTKVASKENLSNITGESYTVQAGDTLFAIAFYSGNDYRDIAKMNSLRPPFTIKIGQNLDLIANKKRNIIVAQKKPQSLSVQKSNEIDIDSSAQQGYGNRKRKDDKQSVIKRKQIVKRTETPTPYINNSPLNVEWIWPANGNNHIATVGSDGTSRGLDIKGRLGSKIVASADGKIVYAGNALKGYGNLIIIKHNSEYLSAYAHNQAILVGEQTYVKQGQQIATMGNSGASDIMLHFEIRKKGKSIDPFVYLPAS